MQSSKGIGFFLRVGGSLLLISAIIAGLLAAVNSITRDKIAANEQAEVNSTLSDLFGGEVEKTDITGEFEAGVRNVWSVAAGGAPVGHCVYTEAQGYGGVISMMVAFDLSGTVCGIRVVEISETAGLGSRVAGEDYLSQYNGITAEKSPDDVDVITGSTVSSDAVTEGVNLAVRTYNSAVGGVTNE